MKTIAAVTLAALTFGIGTANAEGWRFGLGPSFVGGIDDVMDLYEDNLEAEGYDADVNLLLPIGVGFAADYHWKSGVRVDLGLGPMFIAVGDVEHFELPINATVGYTFMPNSRVSPYVRAGFVHHIVSGDYYIGTDPGLFAAAGVDFARTNSVKFTLEVASDQSEVEFDSYACGTLRCRNTTTTLNTYDFLVSLFIKF